ncbi:MAG: hypothetical protein JST26_02820 [Bacteroidetes bacterium]|nr:hypothetical protein [Bacteroidota bacterium]
MSRPKKILFAAVDVGYRIELYSKFIRETLSDKLEAESLSIYVLPSKHYKTSYTYEFNFYQKNALYRWHRSFVNFFFCLFRFDIFHFISGETLLTRRFQGFELFIYKLLGKRVVMHFVGSDIRSVPYSQWKEKNIRAYLNGNRDFPITTPWQKKLIQRANRYADCILVSTPDLKEIIPQAIYYPVVLDLEKYQAELNAIPEPTKTDKEIVILHSPSNKKIHIKGTEYINEVLYKLAANPRFKIKLILPAEERKDRPTNYSATRYELFSHFKEADIVIDQMTIGWYGLLSVEAIAAGKQVICYIEDSLKTYLYEDCPILNADVNTLEQKLIACIEDMLKHRNNRLKQQQEWVMKHHTIGSNHEPLLQAWGIK